MSSTTKPVPSIDGSCHCGAITFIAKNVKFDWFAKCSCTICNKTGKISLSVEPTNLFVLNDSGNPIVFNSDTPRVSSPSQMGYYSLKEAEYTPESFQVWHNFCKKCGVHTCITGQTTAKKSLFASVNVRCLDLAKVGMELKDLTAPENVTYVDGLSTFRSQHGEPFKGGAW